MSSRGSVVSKDNIPTNEYKTIRITDSGVKILFGTEKKFHSLPDYSHSANAIYAKMKNDGVTLQALRIYGEDHKPIIEIGYHPESRINNGSGEMIVHFHLFKGLDHQDAKRFDKYPDIKEKYKEYLKEFGLYDKC